MEECKGGEPCELCVCMHKKLRSEGSEGQQWRKGRTVEIQRVRWGRVGVEQG